MKQYESIERPKVNGYNENICIGCVINHSDTDMRIFCEICLIEMKRVKNEKVD